MLENISKDYKRASVPKANIARELQLDDRIEAMALKSSFLTLKDHKPDWPATPRPTSASSPKASWTG